MAGRQASSAVTRYAGIQVQTSSAGLQVPMGWGTFRCKCNLLDYLDFTSTPQKVAAAGKGGATVTGYNYSATLILGLCEGEIDAVTQVWVDSSNFAFGSNGSGVANTGTLSATAQAGLNLATGAVGQATWSYLTTKHPDHAIGYSGLALAYVENYALDSSASTPNHSFEVKRVSDFAVGGSYAGPDVDPSKVVADFFNNGSLNPPSGHNPITGVPGWPNGLLDTASLSAAGDSYQAYCVASGLLVSPLVDQQRSATDFLNELLLATNSTVVWSEGVLKFVPYGCQALSGNGATYTPNLTPVYALDDDDFVVGKAGEAPVTCDIQDQSDAYNVVQLEFLDRTNAYNMGIALASDAANVAQYGMRRKDPDTVHCICTPTVAALCAQLYLQRTLYVRAQYKFKLGWMFALLEPGDIVEITDAGMGLAAYPVRITQIDEDEKYGLSLTAEDLLASVTHSPLYTMQTGQAVGVNGAVDPGGVEAQLFAYPNTFSSWPNANGTLTPNATADPYYGGGDAWRWIPNTTALVQHYLATFPAIFANANYTVSCWFKADGYTGVVINTATTAGDVAWAQFDLSAGVVSGTGVAGGSPTIVGAAIAPFAAGWYRCSLTFIVPSAAGFGIGLNPTVSGSGGYGATAFTANGTSGIYLFGAQLTQGIDVRGAWAGGPTGPLLFNPPTALTPAGIETWVAASGGANWGGANIFVSLDGGATYDFVETINGAGRYGFLDSSLGSGLPTDTTNTMYVDLAPCGGELLGASDAVADQSGTLCLVDGSELVCFSAATPGGPHQFACGGYLRRGVLGTPIGAHAGGAAFVRLDDQVTSLPYLPTQIDQVAYVKFQSFNLWGRAPTLLENCIAYPFIPFPLGARPPAAAAWSAVGTTLSNGGNALPAIVITGACDNASATAIDFEYRQTGTSTWISAGMANANATSRTITSVASGQQYDVSVVYIVGGVPSEREIIASGLTVGAFATPGTSGGGVADNVIVLNTSSGSGTFTMPAGGYAHADIVATAGGGNGGGNAVGGKGSSTDTGGGGGGTSVSAGVSVTPGSTSFTWSVSGTGSVAISGAGVTMTASPGTAGSSVGAGTGGAASGGSTANHTGHNGGLVDTWDGGGAWLPTSATASVTSGGYSDNIFDGSPGSFIGQGGAGAAFIVQTAGGPNIQIITRA